MWLYYRLCHAQSTFRISDACSSSVQDNMTWINTAPPFLGQSIIQDGDHYYRMHAHRLQDVIGDSQPASLSTSLLAQKNPTLRSSQPTRMKLDASQCTPQLASRRPSLSIKCGIIRYFGTGPLTIEHREA
jgi:hypothetical protein